MPGRFMQELSRRVLVFDGAMGTSIYSRTLSVEHDYCGCENCTDILVKSRPDVIQEIHGHLGDNVDKRLCKAKACDVEKIAEDEIEDHLTEVVWL